MIEVNNGLSAELNAKVLHSQLLVLNSNQQHVRFTSDNNLRIDFMFRGNNYSAPNVRARAEGDGFVIELIDFGSATGMAASGRIHNIIPRETPLRAGSWYLMYNLVVQIVGDPTRPTRIFSFTLSEARLA